MRLRRYSLTEMSRLLPGINIPDLGPRASNSNIIIRGLNANDPGGSAYLPWESVPLVSTYVDDVPLFVNLNLSDVQRVEMLRGPQGTLSRRQYPFDDLGRSVQFLRATNQQ